MKVLIETDTGKQIKYPLDKLVGEIIARVLNTTTVQSKGYVSGDMVRIVSKLVLK